MCDRKAKTTRERGQTTKLNKSVIGFIQLTIGHRCAIVLLELSKSNGTFLYLYFTLFVRKHDCLVYLFFSGYGTH